MTHILKPLPITAERFAPFGDLIAAGRSERSTMNETRFARYNDQARLDVDPRDGGRLAVTIVQSRAATRLPYRFNMVERHPLGSQAFIPLSGFRFVVVVAAPAGSVEAADLFAFVTNAGEGINYRRGTWHMPLVALEDGQQFLLIDRVGGGNNCDEHVLDDFIELQAP